MQELLPGKQRQGPRGRHDIAFYLLEALVTLAAAPLAAAYVHEIGHGGQCVGSMGLDRLQAPSI